MSTEKLLSELSKPVAWCVGDAILFNPDTVEAYVSRTKLTAIPLYSQEYVSALREDAAKWFKAFEKAVSVGARYEERIAELEERLALVREQRDNELRTNFELEKLLTTPAPTVPEEMTGSIAMTQYGIKPSNYKQWVKGYNACRAAMLAAAPGGKE